MKVIIREMQEKGDYTRNEREVIIMMNVRDK